MVDDVCYCSVVGADSTKGRSAKNTGTHVTPRGRIEKSFEALYAIDTDGFRSDRIQVGLS